MCRSDTPDDAKRTQVNKSEVLQTLFFSIFCRTKDEDIASLIEDSKKFKAESIEQLPDDESIDTDEAGLTVTHDTLCHVH